MKEALVSESVTTPSAISNQNEQQQNDAFETGTASRVPIQAKLTVGATDDPMEHEADAMADKVMRMPQQSFIQRKCDHCEEEEKTPSVMRKAESVNAGMQASSSLVSSLNATKGNGEPLPQRSQNFMENAFGTNFSSVRLHTDNQAAEMNESIQAKAFTHGNDIYFNSGQLDTESTEGNKLLAHELTHTIQQGESVNRMVQRTPNQATQRQTAISNARARAFHRVNLAYLRINGTSPGFSQAEELQRVRGLIAPDIVNFDQIVEIVSSIMTRLGSDTSIEIGPEITQCTGDMGWVAYVTGNRLPIHLCNRFFRSTPEQQTRTLIHEAAHAAGIGEPTGETYFPIFDCSASQADNWLVADAWARYIHCVSGQTPD
ncbi:MAG: hypothetical protein JWQ25_3153 [Daejeonella sp.]|nr:hypothetical protein [Daejeonella sp.]